FINLIFSCWITYKIATLTQNINKLRIDIDNLGAVIRQNKASMEGKLTRFIIEVSNHFHQIHRDTNFSYPHEDS
ncbi:MAG: hypothetical protein ACKPH7_07845, partial [Planktothrix sp.]|uniref:hypothetical protein n=1 Tax=Planktothrix sp. TaxID=3088171 RepID=UPI0038D3834A